MEEGNCRGFVGDDKDVTILDLAGRHGLIGLTAESGQRVGEGT